MKSKYRSKLELYVEILTECRCELLHSEICRKCNISHYDTTRHLEFLLACGMLNKTELDGKYSKGGEQRQR